MHGAGFIVINIASLVFFQGPRQNSGRNGAVVKKKKKHFYAILTGREKVTSNYCPFSIKTRENRSLDRKMIKDNNVVEKTSRVCQPHLTEV